MTKLICPYCEGDCINLDPRNYYDMCPEFISEEILSDQDPDPMVVNRPNQRWISVLPKYG